LTLQAKARVKELTFKAKDRTKDLTLQAKARIKNLTFKAKDTTRDLSLKAKAKNKHLNLVLRTTKDQRPKPRTTSVIRLCPHSCIKLSVS